jgi:hypothetical protein
VVLDKDLREEIDTAQAVVDSTVYISFVLYVSAIFALIYAGIEALLNADWYTRAALPGLASLYIPKQSMLLVIAANCLIFARLVYRISLPAHAQFGELFKSIFDQYRSKLSFNDVVKEIGEVIGDPQLRYRSTREKNQIVWRYLKWHSARDDVAKENLKIKEWEARKKGGAP